MRHFRDCHRGSVAFATVIAAIPIIGMLALGGEAGTWYVTKRHAQNAADAAAFSGALRLACSLGAIPCTDNPGACSDLTTCVSYRSKQYAAKNGFCDGSSTSFSGCPIFSSGKTLQSVQADVGTWDGTTWTTSASGTYVRAIVGQSQPAVLSALLGLKTININTQAVAQVTNPQPLCSLGLGRNSGSGSPASALTLGGSVSITGNGCGLMSDNTVKYNSTPGFSGTGWSVDAVNGCTNSGNCDPGVPYNYYMATATNPLSKLDSEPFNSASSSNPPKACGGNVTNNNNTPCSLSPNTPTTMYGDLKVTGGTVTMAAGTYFFYNATIAISGGTVTGAGVNIVLLGDSSVSITGGTVKLSANSSNSTYPDLNGVLFDDQAPNKSKNAVTINGGSGVIIALGGAMYFPNVDVTWSGTSQNANTNCSMMVANTITMSGNAYMSTQGCAPGTISQTQVVRLVP